MIGIRLPLDLPKPYIPSLDSLQQGTDLATVVSSNDLSPNGTDSCSQICAGDEQLVDFVVVSAIWAARLLLLHKIVLYIEH